MTNEDRWNIFISELKAYIEVYQKCPPKHCTLYNAPKYYGRKMKEGTLDEEKVKELESVLGLRDLKLHTGGRKKKIIDIYESSRYRDIAF